MEEILSTDVAEAGTVAEEIAESSVAEEELVPKKKKGRHVNQQKLLDNIWGWVFCIPLIVGTVWFVYSALVMAVMLSFSDYDMSLTASLGEVLADLGGHMRSGVKTEYIEGIPVTTLEDPSPWFWYKQVFTGVIKPSSGAVFNEMGIYLFNTVFYMIGIPIGMVLSMFFAVCMSRDIKGGNVFRVLYYIPCVASTISIVYTFKIMFNQSGVINQLFGSNFDWIKGSTTWNQVFGKASESDFMRDPYWCQGLANKFVIVVMSVWKGLGGTIILYVAGLSGVNAATKEAAQIDGANGWQIFWKVTMPDLYPTIFYNIVTSVIGGMQIYAEPVLLFGESYLTSGYVSLIYSYGLEGRMTDARDPSAGAAYGMVLAVMIFFMTLFQFWLDSRKKD